MHSLYVLQVWEREIQKYLHGVEKLQEFTEYIREAKEYFTSILNTGI